jgi:hypothetical protein
MRSGHRPEPGSWQRPARERSRNAISIASSVGVVGPMEALYTASGDVRIARAADLRVRHTWAPYLRPPPPCASACDPHEHVPRAPPRCQASGSTPERRLFGSVTGSIVPSEIPSVALRVHVATPDHLVGTWHDVAVTVWRGETTLEGIRATERSYHELRLRYPGGVHALTVIEEGAPLPGPELRRELTAVLERSTRTVLSAVVYEGKGFRAASVRGVVTGLAALRRLPYPQKIFESVADAARWFDAMAKTKSRPAAAALERALEDARRQICEAAPKPRGDAQT